MIEESREYKLELKIDVADPAAPVSMVVTSNPVETEEQLNERISKLKLAIHWLEIQVENEQRIWQG